MKMNINKYWIGYLTGIIIILNIFSAGVVISYSFSWNWIYFIWIYFITLISLLLITFLYNKQKKEGGGDT